MADTATIIGVVLGFILVGIGIVITPGATLMMFLDAPSAFIVLGGTVCALMVNFSFRDLKSFLSVARLTFILPPGAPVKIVADFRRYAEIARRDGILALERVTGEIKDPFLLNGVQLAVDGTAPEVIQNILQTEVEYMTARHDRGIKMMKQVAAYAPAFGMIGTLIGLVIMLQNLRDTSLIGPSMAVAIITTFYGSMVAYLIAAPMSEKLSVRSSEEALVKEMVIKGLMAIQSGDSPRVVEQKLKIIMAPRMRRF